MTKANDAMGLKQETPRDADVGQLLHPARFYGRPDDVVADDLLTIDERRAILSSWASDACAVESNPALRKPPSASAPVTFDEIREALFRLDRIARTAATRVVKLRRRQRDTYFEFHRPLSQRDALSGAA